MDSKNEIATLEARIEHIQNERLKLIKELQVKSGAVLLSIIALFVIVAFDFMDLGFNLLNAVTALIIAVPIGYTISYFVVKNNPPTYSDLKD